MKVTEAAIKINLAPDRQADDVTAIKSAYTIHRQRKCVNGCDVYCRENACFETLTG